MRTQSELAVNDVFDELAQHNRLLERRLAATRHTLDLVQRLNHVFDEAIDRALLPESTRLTVETLEKETRAALSAQTALEPNTCVTCHKSFKYRKSFERHQTGCGRQRFSCAHCHFRSTSRAAVRDHQSGHERTEPYACSQCEKTFAQLSSLQNHTRYVHGARVHRCAWVGCEFATKFAHRLRVHENVHLHVQPFVCDWPGCDFRTSYRDKLKFHKHRHTGQKDYACAWPTCDQRFREKSHLTVHMLKHTQEKPHSCAHCSQRFQTKQSMRLHVKRRHPTTGDD